MPRSRPIAVLFTLILVLLCVLPAAAEDPSACLSQPDRKCYATNNTNFGDAGGIQNGLRETPWLATTGAQAAALYNDVANGAKNTGGGVFVLINCPRATGSYNSCGATVTEFGGDGIAIAISRTDVQAPGVGVPLPFSYILLGGALLAAVLLAFGMILRRNARALHL